MEFGDGVWCGGLGKGVGYDIGERSWLDLIE